MNINGSFLNTNKDISDRYLAIGSDIHLSSNMKDGKLREIIDSFSETKPNYIFIPGDLYNVCDGLVDCDIDKIRNFINQLTDICDVFYVNGNMELQGESVLKDIISNERFHILKDTYFEHTDDGMNVFGIELSKEFYQLSESDKVKFILLKYRDYFNYLVDRCNDSEFNVLLCHDPIIIDAYQELLGLQKMDLVISGHNHGGMYPNGLKPVFKLMGADMDKVYPKYTKGQIVKNDTHFIISEGITKFHSQFGPLSSLEDFHTGSIEVLNVKSRIRKRF